MARMPGNESVGWQGGSCVVRGVADQVLTEAEKAARAKAEKEAWHRAYGLIED